MIKPVQGKKINHSSGKKLILKSRASAQFHLKGFNIFQNENPITHQLISNHFCKLSTCKSRKTLIGTENYVLFTKFEKLTRQFWAQKSKSRQKRKIFAYFCLNKPKIVNFYNKHLLLHNNKTTALWSFAQIKWPPADPPLTLGLSINGRRRP